ncbi:MAG: glutamate 5-kinase [Gemmatimonadetes bacterium]|nr:glutamate 5-kinase [Gemmatimonadota bacterium]
MSSKSGADRAGSGRKGSGRDFGELRRVVVKVGSGIIAPAGRLDPLVIERIAKDVTALRDKGLEVVMVVSGAVAAGYLGMGKDRPPVSVVERQAAAAVGQYQLMTMFASVFEKRDTVVAQLLMMQDDIEDRRRFLSARHTMQELLSRGVLPIINENDPLADDEAKIGDNDHLAALVTSLITADLLVILSTVAGVLRLGDEVVAEDGEAEDGASVISTIEVGSEIDRHITDDQTETGVGGMRAKVRAARLASDWGVPTVIASGIEPGLLSRVVSGEEVGSLFVPAKKRLTERKRWIAIRTRSRGSIAVDDGAKRALVERGASLLPAGIVEVEGGFGIGERVDLLDGSGQAFAVGLVSYPASEIRRMKGRQSDEFLEVLGYKYVEEIVHREDLVLLDVKNNTGESVDDNGASVDDNAESFDAGENRG